MNLFDAEILPEKHPYLKALEDSDIATIKAYWQAGINVHSQGEYVPHALNQALKWNDLALAKECLDHGFEVDYLCDAFGGTALQHAVLGDKAGSHFDFSKLLLEHQADPNHRDKHDLTPTLVAVIRGNYKLWELFESSGGDIYVETFQKKNALLLAGQGQDIHLLDRLIARGFDINSSDISGETIFYRATRGGRLAVVKWAIEKGADIHVKDKSGNNALFWARTNKHLAVAELLESIGLE